MRCFARASCPKVKGFTITEALVTSLVFSFFVTVVFLTIAWGFRTFSLAVARSDVSTEARRLALFMETELLTSDYFSVSTVSRSVRNDRRDGLCFVSRNDWSHPNSYDAIEGRPAWNRYFVFYVTTEQPTGSFIRAVINPSDSSEVGPFVYGPFAANPATYLTNDPSQNVGTDVEMARVIASSVKSFTVEKIPSTQEVDMRILLRQNSVISRRGDGKREGGTFEVHYRVAPRNTM